MLGLPSSDGQQVRSCIQADFCVWCKIPHTSLPQFWSSFVRTIHFGEVSDDCLLIFVFCVLVCTCVTWMADTLAIDSSLSERTALLTIAVSSAVKRL